MHTRPRIRILHIITTTDTGGAEMMLCKLLARIDGRRFENQVVCLKAPGPLEDKIRDLGVPIACLGLRPDTLQPFGLAQLLSLIRQRQPDIIQTWMYHSDLLGFLSARFAGIKRIIWNIRSSQAPLRGYKITTAGIIQLCAIFSRFPSAVITNSREAMNFHHHLGYRPKRFVMIPNGFDLEIFKPNPTARGKIRQELGKNASALYIGMIARFDPKKDHAGFFQAAKFLLSQTDRPIEFVLCGNGVDNQNPVIQELLESFQIRPFFHLLGKRPDIADVMSGMDIVVLSSASESFPNVLGEAMACGIPCVATNVGESAEIIGDTGEVVPPGAPEELAAAMLRLIQKGSEHRRELGLKARKRILENYDLDFIVKKYERLYFDTMQAESN